MRITLFLLLSPLAPDSPPYDCQATANSSTAINLSWRTPLQANGLIQHYSITYKPLVSISGLNYTNHNDSYTMTTPTNITELLIPQLWKATSYSFSIIAYTIIGGSPVSTDHCAIFTLEDGKVVLCYCDIIVLSL